MWKIESIGGQHNIWEWTNVKLPSFLQWALSADWADLWLILKDVERTFLGTTIMSHVCHCHVELVVFIGVSATETS